jgi:hypothetical protein
MNIEFLPSSHSLSSPQGKTSYTRKEFHKRFVPWSPNWEKPVLFSPGSIAYDSLPLAHVIFKKAEPNNFKNNPIILLFEEPECFRLVQSDYFTRLLFAEQEYLETPFELEPGIITTMNAVLADHRSPFDMFWKKAGLPGVPIAVGVNGSLRSILDSSEVLAFKSKDSAGDMGETVGPPLSGAANLRNFAIQDSGMTLGALIERTFIQVIERELPGLPAPSVARRKAWLDSGRGSKPEVNFSCFIKRESIREYADTIKEIHAGALIIDEHLAPDGALSN